jgi:hypothetical protein
MSPEELAEAQRKAGLAMMIIAMFPAFLVVLAYMMDDNSLHKMKVYSAAWAAALVITGGLILKGYSAAVWLAMVVTGGAGAAMVFMGLNKSKMQGVLIGAALLLTAVPWFARLAINIRRANATKDP